MTVLRLPPYSLREKCFGAEMVTGSPAPFFASGDFGDSTASASWQGKLYRPPSDVANQYPILWHKDSAELWKPSGAYSSVLPSEEFRFRLPPNPFGSPGSLLRLPRSIVFCSSGFGLQIANGNFELMPQSVLDYCEEYSISMIALSDAGNCWCKGLPSSGQIRHSFSSTEKPFGGSGAYSELSVRGKVVDETRFIGGDVLFVTTCGSLWGTLCWDALAYDATLNAPDSIGVWSLPADTVAATGAGCLNMLRANMQINARCVSRFNKVKWVVNCGLLSFDPNQATIASAIRPEFIPEYELKMYSGAPGDETYYSSGDFEEDVFSFFGF